MRVRQRYRGPFTDPITSPSWANVPPDDELVSADLARLSFDHRSHLVCGTHFHEGGHTLTVSTTVVPRPPSQSSGVREDRGRGRRQ
jgi:hypothetical protein